MSHEQSVEQNYSAENGEHWIPYCLNIVDYQVQHWMQLQICMEKEHNGQLSHDISLPITGQLGVGWG
jgi:hypothetical protein